MVEISLSGSGEGPGKATTRGYSTIGFTWVPLTSTGVRERIRGKGLAPRGIPRESTAPTGVRPRCCHGCCQSCCQSRSLGHWIVPRLSALAPGPQPHRRELSGRTAISS
jgi:hypothetical protein